MITSPEGLLAIAEDVFSDNLPRPFLILENLNRVDAGEDLRVVAKDARTTRKKLEEIAAATDPVEAIFGMKLSEAYSTDLLRKARNGVGQLTLGVIAERVFEEIYNDRMRQRGLHLEDARDSRNETDYRVLNGNRKPMFRINIKFYGSPFRNAMDLVGLSPADCFALATYKIHQALVKQDEEHIPYVFVIVGVQDLTGEKVGDAVQDDLAHLASFVKNAPKMTGKRSAEERIVDYVLATSKEAVGGFADEIRNAEWYVLSARRADNLLREKLFQRVYAVRVRAFASNYRRAEVDMHFSVSEDLTKLDDFLEALEEHGPVGLTARLERGTF